MYFQNENTLSIVYGLEPSPLLTQVMAEFSRFLRGHFTVDIEDVIIAYNQSLIVFSIKRAALCKTTLESQILELWQNFYQEGAPCRHLKKGALTDENINTVEKIVLHKNTKNSAVPVLPTSFDLEIPVCYHASLGPDLEAVARFAKLSCAEVIRLHSQKIYTVFALGFAPGFPYLGFVDSQIAMPRKAIPALNIAAGSVGIAHNQTGVYPRQSPGGWQIIGRTPQPCFDFTRPPESASLFTVSMQVKFKPISLAQYHNFKSDHKLINTRVVYGE